MGWCCFFHSFNTSCKTPHSHLCKSPLHKSQVPEAQQLTAQLEIQPLPQADISNSISKPQHNIQIGENITIMSIGKKVHFSSNVTFVNDVRGDLAPMEDDLKQSSGEGDSYESLFSLQLVDGWSTPNEEEVMSKEIINKNDTLVEEAEDEGFTFPTVVQNEVLDKTQFMSQKPKEEELRSEGEEVSVDISLSCWLVDFDQENNVNNTPMSSNAVKSSENKKTNVVSRKRRVLGELSLAEVTGNPSQGLKSLGIMSIKNGSFLNIEPQAATDSDSYCSSMKNIKPEMRKTIKQKSRMPKEDQKVGLEKAIPLGLSLARAAICNGMV